MATLCIRAATVRNSGWRNKPGLSDNRHAADLLAGATLPEVAQHLRDIAAHLDALAAGTLPADNVGTLFGCTFPAGTTPTPPGATADGVYLLLAPLSAGSHVICFGGEIDVPSGQPGGPLDFIEDINYMITVTAR